MLRLRRFLRPVKTTFTGSAEHNITLAERLCEGAELEFAQVFAQQFRLRPGRGTPLPGFSYAEIGDWSLDYGPDLPVALASFAHGAGHVAFLGLGVDADGGVVEAATLSTLVTRLTTADAVADKLGQCAGRYAFVVIKGPIQRLYLDPTGSLGAVYDPEGRRIASTLNLALNRDVRPNDAYPLTQEAIAGHGRFAFGHTPDQIVARLLPNHYLNLVDFRQIRHWPGPMDLNDIDEDMQPDLMCSVTSRLEQVIAALTGHAKHSYLALSGGVDSRVMLACAKPVLDQVTLVTHIENRMGRKEANVARKLARALDQDLTLLDPRLDDTLRISDETRLRQLDQSHRIATAGQGLSDTGHEITQAMQPGGLVLRGNVTGLLKAVMWRKAVREYQHGRPHDSGLGVKMMLLGDNRVQDNADIRMEYEGWYASLPVLAAKRPYDFMTVEHFLAHGLGNDLYGKQRNFHICPFNDRRLIAAATNLPPDQRARLDYTDALLEWRAPELAAQPYSRRSVNVQQRTKQDSGAQALKIA